MKKNKNLLFFLAGLLVVPIFSNFNLLCDSVFELLRVIVGKKAMQHTVEISKIQQEMAQDQDGNNTFAIGFHAPEDEDEVDIDDV